MAKITWTALNKTIEVTDGSTILEAALEHDIPLEHICGGYCACTTCHVHIQNGTEYISAPEEEEIERLEFIDKKAPTSRLGCQTKVFGEISIEIP